MFDRADINSEKERLLGNRSPHHQKPVQSQTTDSDQEAAKNLKLQSYAHISSSTSGSSINDVQKIGKRAVHPTT